MRKVPLRMMKRPLLLALAAILAAACVTIEPPTRAYEALAVSHGGPPRNEGWSVFRDYTFNADSNEITAPDSAKAREIAVYLERFPSSRVGIDGSDGGRVESVRTAMIHAGVPAGRIQTGAFGDPHRRVESRVVVLVGN